MASLHKQEGKPNWFAAFYDPEGFRRFRSTGTKNRTIARQICLTFERGSILARKGRLSNEKALKIIRETSSAISEAHGKIPADHAQKVLQVTLEDFVRLAGGELTNYTVRTWLESWLNSRTDASKKTLIEYRRIVDLFLKFLGARADRSLSTLQTAQVEKFKEHLAHRVAPSTVNKSLKCLKAAFSNAVAKRQLEFSPAQHVAAVDVDSIQRRPFTAGEISKLLKAATGDWKTMILLGYYTGLRLNDCANLTWENVDLLNAAVIITPKKTRRSSKSKLNIPIAEPLARQLASIAGDKPNAPLCSTLQGRASSWLSGRFYEVMAKAGLVEERDKKKKALGEGRDAKRELNRISFHSLRHNTVSALKSSGASDAVAMDIAGHKTEAISQQYTKIDFETKRKALSQLPDITGELNDR